jgi:phosphate transport system protein
MPSQIELRLEEIANQLKKMEGYAIRALMAIMAPFGKEDAEIADLILLRYSIEKLAQKVEEKAFQTIALLQPVASDLRKLSTYLFVAHHLYRLGRYAHIIGRSVYLVEDHTKHNEIKSFAEIAELAMRTLEISIRAILEEDLSEINQLEQLELKSDKTAEEMYEEIVEFLRHQTDISQMAVMYVIIGRYFERTTDQALMMAERALYMVNGERVKLDLVYRTDLQSSLQTK